MNNRPNDRGARRPAAPAGITAIVGGLLVLGGCSAFDTMGESSRVDYRSEATKTPALDVPPDLTQLAKDNRYRPQGGVVTASGTAAAAAAGSAVPAPAAAVAVKAIGGMRIERLGNERWLVVPQTPEQLWPQLQAFWRERGFTLTVEEAAAGVMETGWAENRSKLPQDFIRRTIGRVFDSFYDSGVRDSFRTRLERTPAGTEVYISHRSLTEQYANPTQKDQPVWRAAPADPQLEAEFLSRLMVKLGTSEGDAKAAVAKPVTAAAATPAAAVRADAVSLDMSEPFDRAWRRVGIALDRTGFTVEDRDRTAGLYFVRYVPNSGTGEEAGFFSKLFGGKDALTLARYRVLVKTAGEGKTTVSVQTSQGAPETGDPAKRIISLIANDLK